jgi:hypothetical protein
MGMYSVLVRGDRECNARQSSSNCYTLMLQDFRTLRSTAYRLCVGVTVTA